jgi:WD40 repeat protein
MKQDEDTGSWDIVAPVMEWGAPEDISMAAYKATGDDMLLVGAGGARRMQVRPVGNRLQLVSKKSYRSQPGASWVSFSRDGGVVASVGTDATVKMWRLDNGTRKWLPAEKIMHVHDGYVTSAVFHPQDGNVLLTAGDDSGGAGVKVWKKNGDTWQPQPRGMDPSVATSVHQAVFSSDGQRVLTVAADGPATVWGFDLATCQLSRPRPLGEHAGSAQCGTFSPDGERIVTAAGGNFFIWNIAGSGSAANELWRKTDAHSEDITAVAFSHDGKRLFTASKDFSVKVWDTRFPGDKSLGGDFKEALLTLEEHQGEVTSVVMSPPPDGRHLLTAGLDGQTIVWRSNEVPNTDVPLQVNSEAADMPGHEISPLLDKGKIPPIAWDLTQCQLAIALMRDGEPISSNKNASLRFVDDTIKENWDVRNLQADGGPQRFVLTLKGTPEGPNGLKTLDSLNSLMRAVNEVESGIQYNDEPALTPESSEAGESAETPGKRSIEIKLGPIKRSFPELERPIEIAKSVPIDAPVDERTETSGTTDGKKRALVQ